MKKAASLKKFLISMVLLTCSIASTAQEKKIDIRPELSKLSPEAQRQLAQTVIEKHACEAELEDKPVCAPQTKNNVIYFLSGALLTFVAITVSHK